jgi:hypothetical protein
MQTGLEPSRRRQHGELEYDIQRPGKEEGLSADLARGQGGANIGRKNLEIVRQEDRERMRKWSPSKAKEP